ncbi:MAG: sialidase family protein, partial [Deltaproteobacteria bacterium]
DNGQVNIFFSASTDNGQTFSTPIDVSNNDGRSITPIQLIVSENNIYIVWTDTSNGGDFDVFFSASTDNGQTFSTTIDVSSDTGFSYFGQMIVQ